MADWLRTTDLLPFAGGMGFLAGLLGLLRLCDAAKALTTRRPRLRQLRAVKARTNRRELEALATAQLYALPPLSGPRCPARLGDLAGWKPAPAVRRHPRRRFPLP